MLNTILKLVWESRKRICFTLPLIPIAPFLYALICFYWAYNYSFAHSFFKDWWRFFHRLLRQGFVRMLFWPRGGWFYFEEPGITRIVWTWDVKSDPRKLTERVPLYRH